MQLLILVYMCKYISPNTSTAPRLYTCLQENTVTSDSPKFHHKLVSKQQCLTGYSQGYLPTNMIPTYMLFTMGGWIRVEMQSQEGNLTEEGAFQLEDTTFCGGGGAF